MRKLVFALKGAKILLRIKVVKFGVTYHIVVDVYISILKVKGLFSARLIQKIFATVFNSHIMQSGISHHFGIGQYVPFADKLFNGFMQCLCQIYYLITDL